MENIFAKLYQVNVNEHIEKKGHFAYLSWPYAVAQLRLADPAASWEVRRFDGLPFLNTDLGVFVEVAVTVQGVTLSQIHPVLDAKNRPIPVPTAFDINTSIQRCLVKAIAMHGLSLYIYAGEDLPQVVEDASAHGNAAPTLPASPTPPAPASATKTSTTASKRKLAAVPASNPSGTITADQIANIETLIADTGSNLERLLAYFGIESLATITVTDYPRVLSALEKKARAA